MLTVEHITTGYGKRQVLTDVSFEVGLGEIVMLTGGNGSGKSTVLKTVYGMLKPWTPRGRIMFEGQDITALPTEALIRLGIVYMPQRENVFEDFTVEENLLTAASIYPKAEAKHRLSRVLETLVRLSELRKRTAFNLSGGERQLLAFGNVWVHTPKLMLLDEPFTGADKENTSLIRDVIQCKRTEMSFVIVEHEKQVFDLSSEKEVKLELGKVRV